VILGASIRDVNRFAWFSTWRYVDRLCWFDFYAVAIVPRRNTSGILPQPKVVSFCFVLCIGKPYIFAVPNVVPSKSSKHQLFVDSTITDVDVGKFAAISVTVYNLCPELLSRTLVGEPPQWVLAETLIFFWGIDANEPNCCLTNGNVVELDGVAIHNTFEFADK